MADLAQGQMSRLGISKRSSVIAKFIARLVLLLGWTSFGTESTCNGALQPQHYQRLIFFVRTKCIFMYMYGVYVFLSLGTIRFTAYSDSPV